MKNASKMSKTIILAVVAVLVTLAAIGTGLVIADRAVVNVNVDGQVQAVELSTATPQVGDVLAEAEVNVEDAVVSPELGATVTDGSIIAVRYQKPFIAVVDGVKTEQVTTAVTVGEALTASGATVKPNAYVSEDLASPIPLEGFAEPVVVSNNKRLVVVAGGKRDRVKTNAVTVADVLDEQNIAVDSNDELSRSLAAYTKPGLKISVVKVRVVEKRMKKRIAPPVVVRETNKLDKGETKVVAIGKPKVLSLKLRLVYKNGTLTRERTVHRKVVSRGTARVVQRGTAPVYSDTPPGGSCAGWGPLLAKHFGAEASKACQVMLCESGGNPRAQNPVSSASGLFQFIDGTWASARAAIPGGSSYSRAMYAPGELQIQAAAAWLRRTSWSQWSCA